MLLQAAVHHPLWNNGKRCYQRFFGWAVGDGALIAMYPQYCYLAFPNSAEVCCLLLLAAAAAVCLAAVLFLHCMLLSLPGAVHYCLGFAASAIARYQGVVCSPAAVQMVAGDALCTNDSPAACWQRLTLDVPHIWYVSWLGQCVLHLLGAAAAYKATDLLLDVVRAYHPVSGSMGLFPPQEPVPDEAVHTLHISIVTGQGAADAQSAQQQLVPICVWKAILVSIHKCLLCISSTWLHDGTLTA
jgi:hypothetical protein